MKTSEKLKMNSVGAGIVSARRKNGITLVALIITIIVMLILVAVSVQVVINSNLIGTAQDAANRTETAYAEESNLGEVKIGEEKYNTIDQYVKSNCSHNYMNGTCSICGDIQETGTTAITIASATDKTAYYGKTVNYTCGDTVVGWKVFYAGTTPGGTEYNIYLIADDYIAWANLGSILQGLVSTDYLSNGGYALSFYDVVSNANYTDGTGATKFTNSPAKNWLKYARSTSIDGGYGYTSTNNNMIVTAMMLDTTVWTQYCNSTYADYAIGTPTLDMFAASWNQTQTTQLYYNATASDEGYYVALGVEPTTNDVFVSVLSESSTTNSLYLLNTSFIAQGYWLASPCAESYRSEYCVSKSGSIEYTRCDSGDYGVRPVVCLSSNVKLTTDSSVAGSCDFGLTK